MTILDSYSKKHRLTKPSRLFSSVIFPLKTFQQVSTIRENLLQFSLDLMRKQWLSTPYSFLFSENTIILYIQNNSTFAI